MTVSRVLLLTAAVALVARAASAQHVDQLRGPVETFPEPFSNLTGLRELSDGRVVIADRLEQAVRVLDLRAGTMVEIGRAGGGPGEYQMPGGLLSLPGDSTLLVDLGNMRLAVIAPDGGFTESTSMVFGQNVFLFPTAADRAGRLYFDQGGVRLSGGQVEREPRAAIVRFQRGSDHMDTVAYVPLPEASGRTRTMSMSGGSRSVSFQGGLSPFAAAGVWAAAPDGSIAIVHADPYRVDWVAPDGSTVTGPVNAYERVRITDADKEAWADRLSQGGTVMMVGGGGSGSGGRAIRMPRPEVDEQEWPEFKPPFPRQAATVTPEGSLWVRRHVAFGEPAMYDVFDADGGRVRQVALPAGRGLIGFGRGTVYLVNVDEDDLQWLEVYERE